MTQPGIEVGEQLRSVLRGLNREVTDETIARRGGPKPATMTNLRGTQPLRVRRGTLDRLDQGFGWDSGTAELLATDRHDGLVWRPPADLLEQMSRDGLVDYGPFWARADTPEEDALHRRVAASIEAGVSAIRKPALTGEGPVGERATAVQVGAVREFISTMRDALDKLEEAFDEDDLP